MRSRRSLLVLSVLLAFLLVFGIYTSFGQDRFRQFTLDHELKVILEENRNAPVAALQIWVNVGSGDEKDEEAGMCHFIEHMIFKGTEKRKVREMALNSMAWDMISIKNIGRRFKRSRRKMSIEWLKNIST